MTVTNNEIGAASTPTADSPIVEVQHFTLRELVDVLSANGIRISLKTLQRMVRKREIGHRKVASRIFIGSDQLDEYFRRNTFNGK